MRFSQIIKVGLQSLLRMLMLCLHFFVFVFQRQYMTYKRNLKEQKLYFREEWGVSTVL